MTTTEKIYDVAIIGSGIGGSTLATVLARQGLSVIVFEGGVHPRFTIGESMILETSEAMRALAEFYDVPELAYFSSENFYSYIGTGHGVKRHFSFIHHTTGQKQDVRNSLQAIIPKLPYGHEIHIHRQGPRNAGNQRGSRLEKPPRSLDLEPFRGCCGHRPSVPPVLETRHVRAGHVG